MITFGSSDRACERCKQKDSQRVSIISGKKAIVTMCVFCLGEAIASFTGWKVAPMLRQWNAISSFWKSQPKPVKKGNVTRGVKRLGKSE